ncbi:hypothetical protein PO909_012486 [Leuciscus waleckii]
MKDTAESKDQQLTVALRIRPLSDAELEEGATIIAHKVDDQGGSMLFRLLINGHNISPASSRLFTGVESSPHGRGVVSSQAWSRLLTDVGRLLTGVESSSRAWSRLGVGRLLMGVESSWRRSSPHGRGVILASVVSSRAWSHLLTGVESSWRRPYPHGRGVVSSRASVVSSSPRLCTGFVGSFLDP